MDDAYRGHGPKIVIGLAITLAGHGGVACMMRAATCNDVRSAAVITSGRPELEGRVVAVTGTIESEESVEDPQLVRADHYIALSRVVETPHTDSDHDLRWRWDDAIATPKGTKLAEQTWTVGRATVGGLVVPVAKARQHRGLPDLDLTVEKVRLATATGEHGLVWDEGSRAFYVPVFPGAGESAALKSPEGKFVGRVRFEGYRAGTVVTVVGRQVRGELTPVPLAAEGSEGVLIVRGKKAPDAIAAEVESSVVMKGSFVGLLCLSTAGLVLVFMHPAMVIGWFVFMGVGFFFGKLASDGIREAIPQFLFLVGAIGSLVATMFFSMMPSAIPVVIWLAVFAGIVLALKRLDAAEELEEEP